MHIILHKLYSENNFYQPKVCPHKELFFSSPTLSTTNKLWTQSFSVFIVLKVSQSKKNQKTEHVFCVIEMSHWTNELFFLPTVKLSQINDVQHLSLNLSCVFLTVFDILTNFSSVSDEISLLSLWANNPHIAALSVISEPQQQNRLITELMTLQSVRKQTQGEDTGRKTVWHCLTHTHTHSLT